ncbi:MAG: glycogen/starch synthase [Prevotellaceae bacterium]|nr:glycogen/starch synthase [Prevotellaceae bacterium]
MAKKILFINQEMLPYVPESEMSNMGRLAPQKVVEKGFEIRTFMPKWGNINERRGQLHEVIRLSGMNLIINETDHPLIIKVASMQACRTQVYFIDNDDYFTKRLMGVDADGKPYGDNGERAIFFARGVLETVKKLRWVPDIIHCQGWMSYAVPLFVKTAYADEPSFANAKVVTSLFGNELEGSVCDDFRDCIAYRSVDGSVLSDYPETITYRELAKIAIGYSDAVVEATGDVNADLSAFAAASGKPFLSYPGDDFGKAYADFYNSLLG